jgi:hypothetical protein
MRRRTYLATLGLITSTTLAGCSGGPTGNNTSGSGNGSGGTTATSGGATDTSTSTESDQTPQADTEAETEPATGTEIKTATPSGGGSGNLEVSESELVVEEGQYTTDIAMTGLLENTGNSTLRLPEIQVTFYDDSDSVLSNSTRSLVFLEPGDRWDIRVLYVDDTTPARGEIEVMSTEVYQTELGIPTPLKLTEQNLQTGAEPQISATLQNTSNNSIDVAAFGVFYAEDSVALTDGIDSLNGLAGGESWSVTLDSLLTPEERAQRVTDYTLYANVL